jgi:membrane associated rhomboid family serine protease
MAAEVILRVAADEARALAWAFVLEALVIPHRIASTTVGFAIAVEAQDAARAAAALEAHDREALEAREHDPAAPDHGPSRAPLIVIGGLLAMFVVTGARGDGDPGGWFRAGSAVAEQILRGAWWRAVTALTLHADAAHVAGNAVALLVFLSALCRWLGTGLALLLVLATGVAGNLLTAMFYSTGHDSIGASTAAFGALGLLGGLQFVRRYRVTTPIASGAGGLRPPEPIAGGHGDPPRVPIYDDRRRRALMAVAACLALFAMLGVGERTDVAAHLFGLGTGLILGASVGAGLRTRVKPVAQAVLGAGAAAVVALAWALARR